MGDESFTLEGLTVEEIKRSMAILQAKKIKAYAKRAALTIRIDEAKFGYYNYIKSFGCIDE